MFARKHSPRQSANNSALNYWWCDEMMQNKSHSKHSCWICIFVVFFLLPKRFSTIQTRYVNITTIKKCKKVFINLEYFLAQHITHKCFKKFIYKYMYNIWSHKFSNFFKFENPNTIKKWFQWENLDFQLNFKYTAVVYK